VTPLAGSTRATEAKVIDVDLIEILNFVQVEQNVAPYKYSFALSDITTQVSAKDAGNWSITTYYLGPGDGKFYVVDTQTVDYSFTATTGLLTSEKDIIIDKPLNFADNAVYTFTFSEDSMLPKGGFIKIEFPPEIYFNQRVAMTAGTCAQTKCQVFGDRTIIVQTAQMTPKNKIVAVEIGGVKNQRSFNPSGSFTITTFDTDGVSLIDIGFKKNVATSIAGNIDSFTVERTNTTNGAINRYRFTLTTTIPMVSGDVLKFSFPESIVVNAGGSTICTPINDKDRIVCGISGNDIQITLLKLETENKLQWSMTQIKNPGSVQPSGSFKNIMFESESNYLVQKYQSTEPVAVVTNTIPANIQVYNLFQDSLQNSAVNNYTISFNPVNALPATGSIKLIYPAQISLPDGAATKCFVTTNRLFSSNCKIDVATRTITITKVFETAAPYSSEITIML